MRTASSPALIASVLLHGGIFALALLKVAPPERLPIGDAVPVTIVSSMPQAAPAETGPETVEATAPEVVETPPVETPEVAAPPPPPPEPTPPTPAPKQKVTPPPPAPTPKAKAQPTPPQKTPPAKTAPTKSPPAKSRPSDALDLDALSADLAKSTKKGPPRKAQAQTSSTGQSRSGALSAAAGVQLGALVAKISDRWNLNCEVAAAENIAVPISFTIGRTGRVIDGPELREQRSDPVWRAAAVAAMRAVRAAEPYEGLPAELYNVELRPTFRASEACRNR
jgi:outer membrane biosynthesis protein TonB